MESTTETGFFITTCRDGLKVAQGQRRPFDSSWHGMIGTLHDLTPGRWWWSPHTWAGDHRGAERWQAASCIALDLDWHASWEAKTDKTGRERFKPCHEAPPGWATERLEAALMELPPELECGGVLAHHTPRGARLVLLLTEPVTDRDLFVRAAAGADALVTRWLESVGLLGVADGVTPPAGVRHGDELERPGYEVDHGAAIDLARVLWGPRALSEDPDTGRTLQRNATVRGYGDDAARFDARELARLAPSTLTATKTDAAQDHTPHASWGALEAVLKKAPQATATDKGVRVCCPMHADSTPSAIVFPTGVLKCLSSGCAANATPLPLERWAGSDGGRALLGDELVRVLTAPVRGDVLGSYWRTIGEWGADRGDWLEVAPPPMDWLLTVPPTREADRRQVLPRGVVGMLAAAGGVGKSMALVQLAVAVATGKPWLVGAAEGRFPGFETHNGAGDRVLLALGEEDELKARRRLYQAVQAAQLTPDERELLRDRLVVLPLASVPVGLMADRREREEARAGAIADELERRLADGGPWSLVVLDPLSRFAGMETEGDNAAATRFVQVLERFAKAPGSPAVLVSHHTGQGARREGMHDATAARGVTGLTDGVRWVATLTREVPKKDGDEEAAPTAAAMLKMAVTKNNYAGELWPFWLSRGDGGLLRCATKRDVEAFKRAAVKAAKAPKQTRDDGLGDDL